MWQRASDADADLDLDYDALNPHFEYIDEDNNQRHVVWFLDGVTVLNEMRAARALGLQTFALWRLGEEDSSLWNVWDKPSSPESLQALGHGAAGARRRHRGRWRHYARDRPAASRASAPSKWIPTNPTRARSSSSMSTWTCIPRTYTVQQYGYHPNEVALSFDDGPDPKWTPKILDILKRKGVKGPSC